MTAPPMFLPHSGVNLDSITATAPFPLDPFRFSRCLATLLALGCTPFGNPGATYAVEKHSNLSQVAKKSFSQLL